MQRSIARLLLLVVLAGTLAPVALAAAAPPRHACCIRKTIHHCHDSATSEQISETGKLAVRATSCCNHDCCRAVTTARWAHSEPTASAFFAENVAAYLGQPIPVSSNTEVSQLQSSRAPPAFQSLSQI